MASFATGVLTPVLGKLSTLLEKQYGMLKGLRDEVLSLKDELSSMNALLLKLADMDDLDIQVKEWMNQIRELSYDIEDCIDDFTHRVDRGPNKPDNLKGFFRKSIHKVRTLAARNEIASQILKLKARVDDASERHRRYNFDGAISSSSSVVPIDPRLPALYAEAESLVGIDEPREELIKWLTEGEGMSEQRPKVVSVVGLGGLGKTTLARQVYDKIGGQFDCQAFVSVSQKPDMRKILRKILSGVTGRKNYPGIEAYDEEQLINELREFLNDKRYFIVIDDIWSDSVWPTIRSALLENILCSRILTTTRNISVAKSCCFPDYHNVCEMESLSDFNAEKLFFKRIFGSEDHPPSELKEVSSEILRKCGGLPLAIISIAGLLADKPRTKEHWGRCLNSIGSAHGSAHEDMQRILSLSYNDLPHHLKTCLLYLSVYPEDFELAKCNVIWRWMAEGFITAAVGQNLVEVGECYFNELINRSMIIPLDILYDGQAEACEVHDMILDLIVSKSIEEKFITFGKNIHLLGQQDKVRRLSLDFRDQEDIMIPSTMVFSKARSLDIYGSTKHMPPLSGFQALRVIYIEFNDKLENHYLDDIGRLFRLKYIGLFFVSISKLPDQIGELQQLETLELIETEIKELPKSIVRLKKLMFLRAHDDVSLPEGIGNMRALQDLYSMKVDNSIGSTSLQELGSLTELRYLGIHWCVSDTYNDQKSYTDSFVSSISRLCRFKLRRLHLQCDDQNGCSLDFLLDSWSPPPCLLQYFGMYTDYYFPRIPEWVASLSNITNLEINIDPVGEEVLGILGGLPSLLALVLWTTAVALKGSLVICNSGFQCLKEFMFESWNIAMGPLVFEVGAMPKLEKFVFSLVARDVGSPCSDCFLGLQHIPSLKHLLVDIVCTDARAQEVEAIEAFARNLSNLHGRHLRIEIHRYWTEHMVKDEDNPVDKRNQGLKLFGFGIPDKGFYSLQVPGLQLPEQQAATGVISVKEGVATVQRIEAELKHLIQANWDWKVRKISESEYEVVFPSKEALETWSKARGVELALHSIKAKVEKSMLDLEASSMLMTSWVKVSGIPLTAKTEKLVKEVTSTIGEPLEVDEISLMNAGPVRVKVYCRDPSEINRFVEIFINSVGYEIKFEAEGSFASKQRGSYKTSGSEDHVEISMKYQRLV